MNKMKLFGLLTVIPFLCGCFNHASSPIYPDADKYLVGNQTYASPVTSINIDWAYGKVTLVSDTSITGATLVEENNLPEAEKVHSYLKGSELLVKFFASGHSASNINQKDKELLLTYNPSEIKKFNISSTSATVVAPVLVASESISIAMTSGNATVEGVNTPHANFSMTSGSLKVNNLNTVRTAITLTSGNVNIKDIDCEEMDVDMTSGDVALSFVEFVNTNIDMTSGSANITLPADGGIATINKTSGKVTTNRECIISGNKYTFGNSQATINVDMTSGSIIIS